MALEKKEVVSESSGNAKQEQVHDLLFNREIGWKEIIYDLINTEQLDPWDVDIIVLTNRYLEQVEKLQQTDFFVSGKVLFAAALLLRIKSDILLNKHIKSIDEILFGKKEEEVKSREKIELDGEIPKLVPKTPMPRHKKVTLNELMGALNKAIKTENRRIKKEIIKKNALRETAISLPKKEKRSIKHKIRDLYERLIEQLERGDPKKEKVSFTEFVGEGREERIISFNPLLHLDHQKKIWLAQERHFEEIYIWLKKTYFANNPDPFKELRKEMKEKMKNLDSDKKKRIEKINKDFENPLADFFG